MMIVHCERFEAIPLGTQIAVGKESIVLWENDFERGVDCIVGGELSVL